MLNILYSVGSEILKKQGRNIKLRTLSSDLGGRHFGLKKKRFCGLEQSFRNMRNVLTIVDLYYVPKNQKEIVKDFCIKGAGSPEGILFINTK